MKSHPQDLLKSGIAILEPLMRLHGFTYIPGATGIGSGGQYASGEYQRGDRRLELHYRQSLGLVTYHVADIVLTHQDYMWSVLGRRGASRYPGFSQVPLDDFRDLYADLESHGFDFLGGSNQDFASHLQRVQALKATLSRLPG